MLTSDESRTDVLAAERTHRLVREKVAAARGDPPALGASRSHAGYLRDVPEPGPASSDQRPKGRTKIATETKTLKVGDPAPDFTLRSHDGRTITLSALRGQRVVIAFMAFAFSGT
jgi:hypothetical protein